VSKKDHRSKVEESKVQGLQNTKNMAKAGEARKDAFVSSRNKQDQAKRDHRSETSKSK
jgi:hypothetical protein